MCIIMKRVHGHDDEFSICINHDVSCEHTYIETDQNSVIKMMEALFPSGLVQMAEFSNILKQSGLKSTLLKMAPWFLLQ